MILDMELGDILTRVMYLVSYDHIKLHLTSIKHLALQSSNQNHSFNIFIDRLVMASNGLSSDGSDCAQRAAPYIRECEDNLLEQQRKARDSRDGVEMERKNCW